MKPPTLLLCGSILIMLVSCESLFNKPDEVASVDILDAFYLGVDDDMQDPGGDGNFNNLVKITSESLDSDPVPVNFLNGDGESISRDLYYVHAGPPILISKRYTVIWGEFKFKTKEGKKHSNGLLLDNETGAVYDLTEEKPVKGFISMETGLEYYDADSKLGPVSLVRIR